jgi:hypothetical protein
MQGFKELREACSMILLEDHLLTILGSVGKQLDDDQTLTIQSCISKCSQLGYSVAGMQ